MLLGVTCDGEDPSADYWDCGERFEADFLVSEQDDRSTRLGYVLDHAAEKEGWTIVGRDNPLTALTYCPDCRAQARKDP